MKIKIIADSTCDLPASLLLQNDITLTPLTVVKNDEQFKDGITITPAEIFAHVAAGGALCTTAANSIGEYADVFEQYCPDYDGVLVITLGSGFSACYQNATNAAHELPGVYTIDSRNLSSGSGHLVLAAAEMALGILNLSDANLGLSITGVAGPSYSEEKPIGTVYIALTDGENMWVIKNQFDPNLTRAEVRQKSVYEALDLLRRYLEFYPSILPNGSKVGEPLIPQQTHRPFSG